MGTIALGPDREDLGPGAAFTTIDWGRGVWPYRAYWLWASGAGPIGGAAAPTRAPLRAFQLVMRSSRAPPALAVLAAAAAAALAPAARAAEGEWLAGDCHAHVRPGDDGGHVWATLDGTVARARRQGVRWVILTPHFWRGRPREEARVRALAAFQAEVRERNARRGGGDPLLIPGIEESRRDPGHLGVSFFDVARAYEGRGAHEGSLALAARAEGALLVLNHPFGDLGVDMTWRPWTRGGSGDAEARAITERAQAVEAYNRMIAIGETAILRPRPRRQCERAFAAIERAAIGEGRRLVAVGGSDDHNLFFRPTTWAFVRGPLTEESLREAIVAGRAVCGEDARAASFEGASDLRSEWAPPGAAIEADREVRLRWRGAAEVFRDGVSLGTRDGGLTDAIEPGSRHVYRIVVGRKSWANPIFVNLGRARARRAMF